VVDLSARFAVAFVDSQRFCAAFRTLLELGLDVFLQSRELQVGRGLA